MKVFLFLKSGASVLRRGVGGRRGGGSVVFLAVVYISGGAFSDCGFCFVLLVLFA